MKILRLEYDMASLRMINMFGWRGQEFQKNDTNDNSRSMEVH